MPTYEYECPDCKHRFDRFQRINEKPIRICPKCGGKLNRLVGVGGGFILKKSGNGSSAWNDSEAYCERDKPCCGRDTRCEVKPCEK